MSARPVARPGRTSAGILLFRRRHGQLEVLLVHPGGPYWARRDAGAWMIPKGEIAGDEDPLATARRELAEETGVRVSGPFLELPPIVQRGGKRVLAWACEGDCDAECIRSNTVRIEWPPHSGRLQEFPEVDRAAWLDLAAADARILPSQRPLLIALRERLAVASG